MEHIVLNHALARVGKLINRLLVMDLNPKIVRYVCTCLNMHHDHWVHRVYLNQSRRVGDRQIPRDASEKL